MKHTITALGFLFMAASPVAAASFTTFTNQVAFEAASGTLSSQNFNDVVGEPSFNGVDQTFGDITLRNDTAVGRGFIQQPQFGDPFNVDASAYVSSIVFASQSLS